MRTWGRIYKTTQVVAMLLLRLNFFERRFSTNMKFALEEQSEKDCSSRANFVFVGNLLYRNLAIATT